MKPHKSILLVLSCLLLLSGGCGTPTGSLEPTKPAAASPSPTADPTAAPTPAETEAADNGITRIKVELSDENQTMIGFGAGFTWYSDWMLANAQKKEEIADLFFADAKMTILRFKNEYGYPSKIVDENSRETQIYALARSRAAQYGEDITVLLSCWSPPAYLKSNDSINGGGTLQKNADGGYMYNEYGAWWAESVAAYQNAGVPVDYVSIQNECDFQVSYDGMELAQFETEKEAAYSQAFLSTYDALQASLGNAAPQMLGPETMTFSPTALRLYLKDILDTKPESLAGVAFHLYAGGTSGDTSTGSSNQPDSFNLNLMDNSAAFGDKLPLWQTEFYRGSPLQTAALIHNCLVYGNLNAYIYWGGVWAGDRLTHDIITVGSNGNYAYGSTYWVMRHFSEFIRPGYVRVGASFPYRGFRASAFKSPDGGKLALVVVNDTGEEHHVKLQTDGYDIRDSAVYQSVLTEDAYDQAEYYNELGPLDEEGSLLLKPYSITTIDITGTAA